MNTLDERVTAVYAKIQPLLKEAMLEIGSRARFTEDGRITSELVWIDATPKEDVAAVSQSPVEDLAQPVPEATTETTA